jgi:hypothetical protein
MAETDSQNRLQFDSKLDVNHEKFEFTFDYSFLAPPNGQCRMLHNYLKRRL